MEHKDHDVKKLTRAERIREEAKRALELGQVPKQPLSLHPAFRVEGLTATAPPAVRPPGRRFLELARVKVVTTREGNPLMQKESAPYLAARIEEELRRLTPANRPGRGVELLDLMARLQIADPYRQSAVALRSKALTALFGERFLKSEQDLPSERGPRGRGGSTGPGRERGE